MRTVKLLGLFILCALVGACFPSLPIVTSTSDKGDKTLGKVTLYSERLGNVTVSPNRCQAGDREFFLGGDFVDEQSGFIVRLVFDPLDGAAVRIFTTDASTGKSVVFRRADCPVMHYSIDPTNWRINDVSDYHLSVAFECAKNGDAAKGEVSATHCH